MVLGTVLDFIVKILIYALSFLPTSPIQKWLDNNIHSVNVRQFFGYLNFFVPIGDMVIIFQVILGAYLAYLAYKKIRSVIGGMRQ